MKWASLLLMIGMAGAQTSGTCGADGVHCKEDKPKAPLSDCEKSIVCNYDCSAYLNQLEKECAAKKPKAPPATKDDIRNAVFDEWMADWINKHCHVEYPSAGGAPVTMPIHCSAKVLKP